METPNENIVIQNLDFCFEKMIPNLPQEQQQQKDVDFYYINNEQVDDELTMMTHHATTSNPIWLPADKHPAIAPTEFKNWIETHGTETVTAVNTTKVTVARKKSVLSTVSYQSEDSVISSASSCSSSSSSNSSSSDDDTTPPTTPTTELDYPALPEPEGRQQSSTSGSSMSASPPQPQERKSRAVNKQQEQTIPFVEESKQKKSWLSGLFQDKKNKAKTLKKKSSISNFFSKALSHNGKESNNTKPIDKQSNSKKQNDVVDTKKSKKKNKGEPIVPVLPIRYTIQTERAIYRLSHFKLNNPRRPLRQQVTISNMMYWYLSVNERELYQNHVIQRQQQQSDNDIPISQQATLTPPGAHQSSNFMTPSTKTTTITRSTSPPLSFITAKQANKKKYKPVRNTEYSPTNVQK